MSAMCGRFGLSKEADYVKRRFRLEEIDPDFHVSYNIAPSQKISAILNVNEKRLHLVKWGYIPHWMKKERPLICINARAENIMETNFFKGSFRSRRCIIPADYFFEWRKEAQGKQPYRIFRKDGDCFGLAGIWDVYQEEFTCAIITTRANELVAGLHDRMPVILRPENEREWLTGEDVEGLSRLLTPYPPEEMAMNKVTRKVNDPDYNCADILNGVVN
jgi:putative SOS response-associated peptidase YedK